MLSLELAPQIRVNGLAPGLILPPPGKDEKTYLEQRKHTNPLNQIGRVEDIVEAVVFLLRSNFMTGQILYVDGGQHLRGTVYGT
jgi:NAD(P)-dependent dehydrogenase (short-subunit alcohol dehydrogenase family)